LRQLRFTNNGRIEAKSIKQWTLSNFMPHKMSTDFCNSSVCFASISILADLGRDGTSVDRPCRHSADDGRAAYRPLSDVLQHRRQAVVSAIRSARVRVRPAQLSVRTVGDADAIRDRTPRTSGLVGRRSPPTGDRASRQNHALRDVVHGDRARHEAPGRRLHNVDRYVGMTRFLRRHFRG
jgi:hypothetical protein